jgi:hypothetical protein
MSLYATEASLRFSRRRSPQAQSVTITPVPGRRIRHRRQGEHGKEASKHSAPFTHDNVGRRATHRAIEYRHTSTVTHRVGERRGARTRKTAQRSSTEGHTHSSPTSAASSATSHDRSHHTPPEHTIVYTKEVSGLGVRLDGVEETVATRTREGEERAKPPTCADVTY